jgi:uncharacterized protein DUF742
VTADRSAVATPDEDSGRLVRPYALTGGRTKAQRAYPLEALVATTFMGEHYSDGSSPEAQAICALCHSSRSVAEVAAHLNIPIGVARVLICDLVREGLVLVHEASADAPDTVLLERVLSGLRRL